MVKFVQFLQLWSQNYGKETVGSGNETERSEGIATQIWSGGDFKSSGSQL